MTSSLRTNVWWLLALTGAALLGVSFWLFQGARDNADRADRELQEGMALVEQLRRVKDVSASADGTAALADTAFIPRIEAALGQTEIPMSSLRSVTPRLDRSGAVSYRMVLTPVALRPAAEALQALTGPSEQAGRVTTLVLRSADTPAPDGSGAEMWRVEAEVLDATGNLP